jgi:hypothetical protein
VAVTDRESIIALRSALLADSPTDQQQFERLAATVCAWSRTQRDPQLAIDEFVRILRDWSAR